VTREQPIQQSMNEFFENFSQNINTCIPGYIESWDSEGKTASVIIPFVDYLQKADGEADIRKITPVPVFCIYPRGGGWSIIHPLKKGDPVMVFFSQRSIDEWAESDGASEVSPQEPHYFSKSDAFIIPGLFPSGNNTGEANETDLILSHEDGTQLRLGKDKKVHFTCDRLNIGSDTASTALAKANTTDSRLDTLESKYNTIVSVSAVSGGLLPPGSITPITPGASTASGKAFTND